MSARAKEVAEENDWCSVAQNLVEELGGIWPTEPTYDITITHTWRIRARLAPGIDPDQVTDTYISDSLRLWETPTMDDAWTDCTPIETVGFKVTQTPPPSRPPVPPAPQAGGDTPSPGGGDPPPGIMVTTPDPERNGVS